MISEESGLTSLSLTADTVETTITIIDPSIMATKKDTTMNTKAAIGEASRTCTGEATTSMTDTPITKWRDSIVSSSTTSTASELLTTIPRGTEGGTDSLRLLPRKKKRSDRLISITTLIKIYLFKKHYLEE